MMRFASPTEFVERVEAADPELVPTAKDLIKKAERGETYRKRLGHQRRQLASLNRDREQPPPEVPDVPDAEIEVHHAPYRDRVRAAQANGDVDWLADELIEHDRQQQIHIAKIASQREQLKGVRALRQQRNGANKALANANRARNFIDGLLRNDAPPVDEGTFDLLNDILGMLNGNRS